MAEVGIGFNPAPTPPVPEYPYGLFLIAVFMALGYGVIRRRTRE